METSFCSIFISFCLQKMMVDFHDDGDRFSYGSETLMQTHPSMMTLALHNRTHPNIAKSMTVCLLSALKSHSKSSVIIYINYYLRCRRIYCCNYKYRPTQFQHWWWWFVLDKIHCKSPQNMSAVHTLQLLVSFKVNNIEYFSFYAHEISPNGQ